MQDRIKVVIVDDEPQSIHRLQDDLELWKILR